MNVSALCSVKRSLMPQWDACVLLLSCSLYIFNDKQLWNEDPNTEGTALCFSLSWFDWSHSPTGLCSPDTFSRRAWSSSVLRCPTRWVSSHERRRSLCWSPEVRTQSWRHCPAHGTLFRLTPGGYELGPEHTCWVNLCLFALSCTLITYEQESQCLYGDGHRANLCFS